MGMGGAFTAVADDGTAAYWNPAGLTQLRFGLTPTFGGVGDWQGITDLLQKVGEIEGVNDYTQLGELGIKEACLDLNLGMGLNFSGFALNVFGDASFETAGLTKDRGDLDGLVTGNLALTFAREFTDLLGVGANLKYVYLARSEAGYESQKRTFTYEGNEATVSIPQGNVLYGVGSGFALDLGGLFKVSDLVRAGVMVRNINLGGVKLTGVRNKTDLDTLQQDFIKYIESGKDPNTFVPEEVPMIEEKITGEPYSLPTTMTIGAAFKVPVLHLLLAADYQAPLSGGGDGSFHVGAELPIFGIIFLRGGGYSTAKGFNLTAGVGGKLGPVLVDLATVYADSALSGAYVTLGFRF